MTQEALKLALDALENHTAIKHPQQIHYRDKAITAIKEALAQPEQFCDTNCVWTDHHPDCRLTQTQEPVAWKLPDKNVVFWEDTKEVDEYHGFKPTIPLYTSPPQRTWVGLTQNEVKTCWLGYKARGYPPERVMIFYKFAEQMLKDKNT
jgi:hypothetical protein